MIQRWVKSKLAGLIKVNKGWQPFTTVRNFSQAFCLKSGFPIDASVFASETSRSRKFVSAGEKRICFSFVSDGGYWSMPRVNLNIVSDRQQLVHDRIEQLL